MLAYRIESKGIGAFEDFWPIYQADIQKGDIAIYNTSASVQKCQFLQIPTTLVLWGENWYVNF